MGTPLSTWAGQVLPFAAPILLVVGDSATRDEAIRQLIRIGYDDLRGFLVGGMSAWDTEGLPCARVQFTTVEEPYQERERGEGPPILHVRQDSEWRAGHLAGVLHIEAWHSALAASALPRDERFVVHCSRADRPIVAVSQLQQRGLDQPSPLYGGFSAWEESGYPVEREHDGRHTSAGPTSSE